MQVSDSIRNISTSPSSGTTAEVRQDQVVNASIKQKVSSNEAVVEINGQEYKATFEKGVPSETKVALQITGRQGEVLQVRTITASNAKTEPPSPDAAADKILPDAAMKATPEMKQAIARIIAERMPVTREILQNVQQILQKGEGTTSQKLDVLSTMAGKNISITPKSYEAVFRAIHGPSLGTIVKNLANEAPDLLSPSSRETAGTRFESSEMKEADNSVKQAPVLLTKLANLVLDIRLSGRATRTQMEELNKTVTAVTHEAELSPALMKDIQDISNRLVKDLRKSLSYEAVGRNVEARAMVERSMDTFIKIFKLPVDGISLNGSNAALLDRGTNLVQPNTSEISFLRPVSETFMRLGTLAGLARQELGNTLGMSSAVGEPKELFTGQRQPEQIIQNLANTLRKAFEKEGLPREESRKIEHMLNQLEGDVNTSASPQKIADGVKQMEDLLIQSGERIAALSSVQTANFQRVSQYIPDHLREVGNEFRQIKKEITNNIDRMSQFIQQKVPQAASYVQRIIEPTIEMVNRLVTKGEFALFADMEFEHDVLRISGELQHVKGLLDKGKQEEALQTFQRIRADLDKLNWQPSYMKVERFFSKATGEGAMQNPLQTYGQDWREGTLTGRGMQEWVRGMGYTHEREAIDWMSRREGNVNSPGMQNGTNTDTRGSQEGPPQNFKSILMDGMESHVSPRAKEMMEQALSNVTGHQLLSKQDSGSLMQSLQIQIPLPWEEGIQDVHMQVNGRANSEQMDWENCHLFFFLDTPKFGETGVSVTIVNREVTLLVQNDDINIEQAFTPYIPQLTEQLKGLGYHTHGVAFEPVAKKEQQQDRESLPTVDVATARKQAARYDVQEGLDFSV